MNLDVKLPNIRKAFIPDPGYVIVDCDLSGADAQVVAWEAGDEDLKAAFRAGLKIHAKNFQDMYGIPLEPKHKVEVYPGHLFPPYDNMKRAVHATNYGATARTVAITLAWKVAEAQQFQSRWFKAHPNILSWHEKVERDLQMTRGVTNKFGYRIKYFDRIQGLLGQALAWIPQSTVGIICERGGLRMSDAARWAELLLQVHDSLVFQLPYRRLTPENLSYIRKWLEVVVPYDDPLVVPWEIAISSKSWGDCKKVKWSGEGIDEVLKGEKA